jgi:8-oxo-dGTP diphosphatase
MPADRTLSPSDPGFLPHLDVRVVVFSLRDERLQVLLAPQQPAGTSVLAARWELPGSPVPGDRSLEDTATESVLRLSGLREAYLEQLYTYGDTDRQPEERLISVVYFAIIPGGASSPADPASRPENDACRARWFPVDSLPPLAIDHPEIVEYALRRLRYKLEYSAVGFQLLPERFSLSELQKTYEMILGETLDKRNFRRRILQAGIIEETRHLRSGEGRPARLFRYRPDAVAEVKARRLFP